MSRHHRIIGVPVGASKDEIKKAYRSKAKKLHPDRNPSPKAADQFAELQNAYDILMLGSSGQTSSRSQAGSNTRRKTYTKSNSSSKSRTNSSSSANSKRKTTSKKTYQSERERQRAERAQEARSDERYFQKLVNSKRGKFVHYGAIVCLIISICYVLEAVLPKHRINDEIEMVGNSIGEGRLLPQDQIVHTKGGEEFSLELLGVSWAKSNPHIVIEKTWFFHFPTSIFQKRPVFNLHYTLYLEFWQKIPLPLIFFGFPTILLFYRKRTINFTVVYMTSFYVVLPLTAVFLIKDFRWLHLLTLGFL